MVADFAQIKKLGKQIYGISLVKTILSFLIAFEILVVYLWILSATLGLGKVYNLYALNIFVFRESIDTTMLRSTVSLSVPILITAVGATFNERAGVINIGLEGILIWSAWFSVFISYTTGNIWLATLGGIFAGALLGFFHALLTITFKAEQVVTGVAVNLLALGVTEVLNRAIWEPARSAQVESFSPVDITKIPFIGDFYSLLILSNYYDVPGIGGVFRWLPDIFNALNRHNPLVYIAIFLVPICHFFLFKTKYGLRIRVIGEHPQAAATAGVNVRLYQYISVTLSGALGGLGGTILSIGVSNKFISGMTGGKGFLALAAMIFGKWTVIGGALASVLFGFFFAFGIDLSAGGIKGFVVPIEFYQMIPFIVTILALAGVIGKARAPKSIGIPYSEDEE